MCLGLYCSHVWGCVKVHTGGVLIYNEAMRMGRVLAFTEAMCSGCVRAHTEAMYLHSEHCMDGDVSCMSCVRAVNVYGCGGT